MIQRTDRVSLAAESNVWGGAHIRLLLNDYGGELEYDSGRGTLSEPLRVDSQGCFSIKGTFISEPPGPIRTGLTPKPQMALYEGMLTEDKLELTITLPEQQTTVGSFSLAPGQEGRLWKCK